MQFIVLYYKKHYKLQSNFSLFCRQTSLMMHLTLLIYSHLKAILLFYYFVAVCPTRPFIVVTSLFVVLDLNFIAVESSLFILFLGCSSLSFCFQTKFFYPFLISSFTFPCFVERIALLFLFFSVILRFWSIHLPLYLLCFFSN